MKHRRFSILALTVLLVATLSVACGVALSGCGGTSGTSSTSASAQATPKEGGTLVVAYQAEPTSLDPAIAWNVSDWAVEDVIFEGFFRYTSKPGVAGTELEPTLAERMPTVNADNTVYTIPLKRGIKFQPPVNREVTAEDFKYSFERMMRLPQAPATFYYTGIVGAQEYIDKKVDHISGFKVLDPYTVQITLTSPDSTILNALEMKFCSVVPKEWVEKWGEKKIARHPLGTGPFMFDHWTPSQEVVVKRNPNYRDPGRVWLDEIKFATSLTPQMATLKLQRGEVDVLGDNLPAADIARLTADPNWKDNVASMRQIAVENLFMNVQFKPFDNVKVRQAICWAINRDKLVKLVGGAAEPLWQVYPDGMPGHVPGKKYYGYDPAKAKALLAEAGYPNGFKTTLYTDNVDPRPKIMTSIQADLKAIGITAPVRTMSNAAYYTFSTTPHTASAGASLWIMDFPDPHDWMPLYNKANAVKGGMNSTFWWSPQLEQMIDDAQATTDAQARIVKYEKIQDYIMEQAPYASMYQPVMTTMFSKNVGGFQTHLVYGWEPQWMWKK